MYNDIVESLKRALIVQKWNEGDRLHRIGHPFQWVDVEKSPGAHELSELSAFLAHYTMWYEQYPTPNTIMCADFESALSEIRRVALYVFRLYFPFLPVDEYDKYLDALANKRAQDYGFIRSFSDLGTSGIRHLDIGPGLGSHVLYSRYAFRSLYYGLEAYPESYQVQRNFFRCLSTEDAPYMDFVAAETFGVPDSKLVEIVGYRGEGIVHVPSWKFPVIDDNYFDLVTATWVLNEVNHAGILWLISGSVRTLKVGGYLYIRDSGKRKPGRHDVDYDALLMSLGLEEVGRLQVQNRIDFHGVPRMYRKTKVTIVPSFDELVDRTLGHFGISAQSGAYSMR